MSTSPAIAPILFVSPRRNEEGKDPNRLLMEPFYATPAQVAQNRGPSWCTAWGNGITVIVVGADRAAVRVGSPEHGSVGYTTLEHALAFAAAALKAISEVHRKSDGEQARQDAACGRGR